MTQTIRGLEPTEAVNLGNALERAITQTEALREDERRTLGTLEPLVAVKDYRGTHQLRPAAVGRTPASRREPQRGRMTDRGRTNTQAETDWLEKHADTPAGRAWRHVVYGDAFARDALLEKNAAEAIKPVHGPAGHPVGRSPQRQRGETR